ncbi:MAG: bifunctional phosphoglucose/phosphomannose isomerase [Flavobacteriales bacterium]|nr:bifunctional phosphoglucose/phosphomannose isomerase [Flavobacteriales bacterium]|tara:strand:- start:8052 stop:9038 length:987 start_codon:yes stop_codon:yes gene_type:complete
MRDFIKEFPKHIAHAIQIAEETQLIISNNEIKNILISAQGGSSIAGVMIKNIFNNKLSIPIFINQDYKIPEFVNDKTLFIASSYSGNTEETLSALNKAVSKNCKILAITSGGELLRISKQKGFDYIILPSGGAPRAMLSYSLVQLLYIISKFFLSSEDALKLDLETIKHYLITYQDDIEAKSNIIADKIANKMPFIYTFPEFEGVALRFKQQLNENSKRHACFNIIPEMNHNEIVPWVNKMSCVIPIFLNGSTSSRNIKRMQFSIEKISKNVESFIEVKNIELSYLGQYFYLIHLLDFVSLILAERDEVSSNDIILIDELKEKLNKIN